MKKLFLIAAITAIFSQNLFAAEDSLSEEWKMAPLALPGYTWGNMTYPSSVIHNTPEYHDFVYQGKVEQGADWLKFGDSKQFTLNTFVDLNYTVDSKGLVYNNKVLPGIGVKIRHNWAENGVSEIGIKAVYEDQWKQGGGSGFGVQAFFNYWAGWNLQGK
jgi:hypothetical protein